MRVIGEKMANLLWRFSFKDIGVMMGLIDDFRRKVVYICLIIFVCSLAAISASCMIYFGYAIIKALKMAIIK